jgi:hypothetical protein
MSTQGHRTTSATTLSNLQDLSRIAIPRQQHTHIALQDIHGLPRTIFN